MADPIGGQGLSTTATGGGLPQGQTPNPAQDLGGLQGAAPSLATYYQGGRPGGPQDRAGIDTSGRGFYTPAGGGQPESLANSTAAVKAGLVGAPGPQPGAPVHGILLITKLKSVETWAKTKSVVMIPIADRCSRQSDWSARTPQAPTLTDFANLCSLQADICNALRIVDYLLMVEV